MSQAAYIRDMTIDPTPNLAAGSHEIANFYAHRNVFLTGGTSLLGKLLIERILRSCPNVKNIFLLMREKNGQRPETRFKELFDDLVFGRLRKDRPMFAEKVLLISGDMGMIGLGLSLEERELLRSTNIVIHAAATPPFDTSLRDAAIVNVRGTQEILSLAKEMVDLQAFVYISTAFSNCNHEVIEEKFYPPPIDSDHLLSLLDILNEKSLNHLTPVLLEDWPNTNTFSRAVAEDVIRRKCGRLPLCVVRPSGVIATSKEPIAGWVNNTHGATGILVGASVCLLRTVHGNGEMVVDVIPADYVVSSVIVASWDIAKTQSLNANSMDNLKVPEIKEPPIYNVVSSCHKPITWEKLAKFTEQYMAYIPSVTCLWYYCFRFNKYLWVHKLCEFFLHLIPAAIADGLALLTGRKPTLLQAYKTVQKSSSMIEYFMLRQWRFCNNNILRLWTRMSPADRAEFDLVIGSLNWKDYSYRHIRGIRVYLLNDPMDTVPQGRIRYAKLKVAHYTLITVLCGILVWLLRAFLLFVE